MANPFGNFSGSFGGGDIIAYLGVGNTSEYANALKTADAQAQAFSKKVGMALNAVAIAGAAIFVGSIKAASDFESSFAGVLKTVDGLDDGFGNLTAAGEIMAQQMKDLSLTIPVSVNELNKIAELGGQLGIETDDLVQFTETIAKLGVTTDMTIEAAATEMARFVNITKQVAPEGMTAAQQIERIGSTIVDLGNNFATTESEISAMAQRLGKSGSIIGLTQYQILGVSTALTSVGINAEAGGTAFSKLFIKIASATDKGGYELEQFAKIAGMSAGQFKEAYEKDAGDAISKFIVGLGKVSKQGGSTFSVLEDLGMTEVRLRDSLLGASNASDIFTDALGTAKKAYEENNALNAEATKRFSTFESQLKLLKNVFVIAFVELGEKFLPKLKELVETLTANPEKIADFIENLGKIIMVLGSFAVIAKSVIAINSLKTAMVGLNISLKALTVVGGPIALVIAGFAAMNAAADAFDKKNLQDIMEIESVDDLTNKLKKLEGQLGAIEEAQKRGMLTSSADYKDKAKLAAMIQTTKERIEELEKATKESTDGMGEMTEAEKLAAEMAAKYEAQIKALQGEIAALNNAQGDATDSVKDFSDKITLLDKSIIGIRGEFRYLKPEIKEVKVSQESLNTEYKKGVDRTKEYNEILQEQKEALAHVLTGLGSMTMEFLEFKGASRIAQEGVGLFTDTLTGLITGGLDPVSFAVNLFLFGLKALQEPEINRSIEQISNTLAGVGVELDNIDDLLGLLPDSFNSNVLNYYKEVLDKSVEGMKTATGEAYQNLIDNAQWASDKINDILLGFRLEARYTEILDNLTSITTYALDQLALFGPDWEGFDSIITNMKNAILGGFNELFELTPGTKAFNDLLASLGTAFSTIFSILGEDAGRAFLDEWLTMYGAFLSDSELALFNAWVDSLFDSVETDAIDEMAKAVKDANHEFEILDNWWTGKGTNVPSSDAGGLVGTFGDATKAVKEYRNEFEILDNWWTGNGTKVQSSIATGISAVGDSAGEAGSQMGGYSHAFHHANSEVEKLYETNQSVNDSLQEQIYLVRAVSFEWESFLGFKIDQFDQFLADLGPRGIMWEALNNLKKFGIAFEDTNVDEQIEMWIQGIKDFLLTLDPDSEAYKELAAFLNSFIDAFNELGGSIDKVNVNLGKFSEKSKEIDPTIGGGGDNGGSYYHNGGIITAHNGLSSGSEVIAKLQRGEAVINRSVVNQHGVSAFQELNRSGSLRGFDQDEKQTSQNFIYVDVHEAGPSAYAEVTEQVYPRIKDKQRNFEPGKNPY